MEIQLKELIDQIKEDGVKAAETEAESILNAAREEAAKIIADAQSDADRILANAKSENERMVSSSEAAIRNAGRNLLISFRESVAREIKTLTGENVSAAYSSDVFAQLVVNVVESWAKKPEADNIAVILNSEDLKSLEGTILAGIKSRMLNGVTLKANDNFDGGFRISVNNGNAYYDYSTEAVVEMISNYLSPRVTELLKEAE